MPDAVSVERKTVDFLNKWIEHEVITHFEEITVRHSPPVATGQWQLRVGVSFKSGPQMHQRKFELADAFAQFCEGKVESVQLHESNNSFIYHGNGRIEISATE